MGSDQVPEGYKQTEIGVIPEDWDARRIGSLGDVVRGGSPRPAGDPRFFNGSYIPWLTVASLTNIPEYQLEVCEAHSGLTEVGAKYSRTLEYETVIIANSGATLGVAKLLNIKCCANDGIAALINQKDGDKRYLCHFINTKTKELRDVIATGNGQPNLNTKLIKEILIPFPPLPEQQTIAQALSDVDALIASLDKLIAKQRQLKTAAMQQLLTGKMRLPGFGEGKWNKVLLGELGVFYKGAGIKKDDVLDHGFPCIRYGEIYTKHNDLIREFYSFISENIANESQKIKSGDILFSGSGETAEEIGKCVAFLGNEIAYAGGDIVIFSPREQDSMFLGYLMNHESIVKQKARMGQGDAVVHIQSKNLAQLAFSLPSLEEQRAIATVLSDMDGAIAALETRCTKTQALKQGMMQELLTGRIRLI